MSRRKSNILNLIDEIQKKKNGNNKRNVKHISHSPKIFQHTCNSFCHIFFTLENHQIFAMRFEINDFFCYAVVKMFEMTRL